MRNYQDRTNESNEYDDDFIELNTTISVKVRDADLNPPETRQMFFGIYNPTVHNVWIKLRSVDDDDDSHQGILVTKENPFEIRGGVDNTNEFCAISDTDTPCVSVVIY